MVQITVQCRIVDNGADYRQWCGLLKMVQITDNAGLLIMVRIAANAKEFYFFN